MLNAAPHAHHVVVEREELVRRHDAHLWLIRVNGKEYILGHLTTVECQYMICISAWNVFWQLYWNVSVPCILEHSQCCGENKGAALERLNFVGTRSVPRSSSWTQVEFFPTCPPGWVEAPHLGRGRGVPAMLTHHLQLPLTLCLAYLTWRR